MTTTATSVEEFLSQPVSHVDGLPWPFADDARTFRYTVNVDPARVPRPTAGGQWGATIVDLGGAEYLPTMRERRAILDRDPSRTRILPGMDLACWDLLLYYFRDMAASFPAFMSLDEEPGSGRFRWRNLLLGTEQAFTFGDDATLSYGPLEFLAREVPDDLILVRQRDGAMHVDAACVTFAAGWSVAFTVGMDMHEIHGPVPRMTGMGVTTRAEQFLMRLPADQVYRRVNWNLSRSATRKLDVSLESVPEWHMVRPLAELADADLGSAQLRLEVEHFIRLPMSGAVTFNIRTYMASLDELRTVPVWASQLAAIIEELPPDLAAYKGALGRQAQIAAYLRGSAG